MDANLEKRIQRDAALLARDLKKTSRESFWIGVAVGVVAALALGNAIGYELGADTAVMVPLEPGVKV